jgi:hypothetical protein
VPLVAPFVRGIRSCQHSPVIESRQAAVFDIVSGFILLVNLILLGRQHLLSIVVLLTVNSPNYPCAHCPQSESCSSSNHPGQPMAQ